MSEIILFKDDLPQNFSLDGDIAIDTETMGLNLMRDRLCLLQLSNGDGNAYLIQFKKNNYDCPNLKTMLLDQRRAKIFHFARFDLAAISRYLNIEITNNIFCTKIASKIARTYTDSHGLKELCRELLGIQLSKQQQTSYWGADILTKEQKDYAAHDVFYLHKLRSVLEERLIKEERLQIARDYFAFLPKIVKMDLMGWSGSEIFSH